MLNFLKIKPSQNGEITLSFTDVGQSCCGREFLTWQICSCEFLTWQICLLTLFAKIKFS